MEVRIYQESLEDRSRVIWLEEKVKVKRTRKTNINSLSCVTDTHVVDWAQPGQHKSLPPRSVEGLPPPQIPPSSVIYERAQISRT